MTKNEEFNKVYAQWKKESPNHAAPECEECGSSLIGGDVYSNNYGWYCSTKCLAVNDEGMAVVRTDEADRRAERQQMGICG